MEYHMPEGVQVMRPFATRREEAGRLSRPVGHTSLYRVVWGDGSITTEAIADLVIVGEEARRLWGRLERLQRIKRLNAPELIVNEFERHVRESMAVAAAEAVVFEAEDQDLR